MAGLTLHTSQVNRLSASLPHYQEDFKNLKTLTNELRDQRHKRKLDFLASIPAFSQLDRSVAKAGSSCCPSVLFGCFGDHLLSDSGDVDMRKTGLVYMCCV